MEENNEMMTQNTETPENTPAAPAPEAETPAPEAYVTETPAAPQTWEAPAAEAPATETPAPETYAPETPTAPQTWEAPNFVASQEASAAETPAPEAYAAETPAAPQMQAPNMYPQMQPGMQTPPVSGWQPVPPAQPYGDYRQSGIPMYGYNGAYYNSNVPPMQNGVPGYMGNNPGPAKPAKEKKRHPVLSKVVGALVFGVVAALAFIGCNLLYGYFFPKQAEEYNVVRIGTDSRANVADAVKTADSVETVIATNSDVSSIVEKVAPAIVQIDCVFNTTSYFGSYETPGAGSGIVMRKTDNEILIATNNHVVEGAKTIKITFTDGTTAQAVIKGTDAVADLAVVSVDITALDKEFTDGLTVAKLGSSDDVRVGQMAIAIGNSMGYGQSTTVGYISAKDREVNVDGTKMILIQTDAAINPGNSGGALINVSGEVIGINSVKFASAQVEGMGFAIPISRAQKILDELGNRESLKPEEKGYLGVHVQTVTPSIAQAYNWPIGVYVTEVDEGLAAEAAGIELGDIVIRVNSVTVTTTTDLKTAISSYRAGTKVTITVMRLVDNKFVEKEIEAVLGNEPQPEKDETASDEEAGRKPEEPSEPAEEDTDAPKASPKDGLPETPQSTEPYNPGELPDYFDPFKDFEDMFPFYEW